jgi:lactate racemase
MSLPLLSALPAAGDRLAPGALEDLVDRALDPGGWRGRRVVLIIPDATRTAPIGPVFKAIHRRIGPVAAKLDVLVALGTHAPMPEDAICKRLEITEDERRTRYANVGFINHEWDNPAALRAVGVIPAAEVRALSEGRFTMDVPVTVNRRLFDYDDVVIIGPVFPHEVAGFSGGNKYLFPGVSGPEVLNFFHWLAAVVTNVDIIGHKHTPVRAVIDRAASMVSVRKSCFALVAAGDGAAGAFFGAPEAAWDAASNVSARTHIVWKDRAYKLIVSCAAPLYDELWTGAKAMYKLEPVLAEGGELIIYAPHIREVSVTHGRHIREVGYHCRDYFLSNWERLKDRPWGVLAHCTHVFGGGRFENGVETPRARVTLATGISEEECRQINLGYRRWQDIDLNAFANREGEGILLAPKAGETLYRTGRPPEPPAAAR